MDFVKHKRTVAILLFVELAFIAWPSLETAYGLSLLMGVIYVGITFWFVFGESKWWLYQFAGIAYVMLVTFFMMMQSFQVGFPRIGLHLTLAGLWVLLLSLHLFVERNFPPIRRRPGKPRRDDRYFPD